MMIVAPLACGLAPAGGATLPSLVQTRVKLSGVPPPPASSRIQKATVLSPRQPPAAPLQEGVAVPFVTIDPTNQTLRLHPATLEALGRAPAPICVLGMSGTARDGKSTWLNMYSQWLRERWTTNAGAANRDFDVGHDLDTCTEGGWLKIFTGSETQPILPGTHCSTVVLLDTQGLAKGHQHGLHRMFTLSLLMSSSVVLNVMRQFNDDALERLGAATAHARRMLPDNPFGGDMPNLLVLLRDARLRLQHEGRAIRPDDMLETALQRQNDPLDVTRDAIRYFFHNRTMALMKQPDEHDLVAMMDGGAAVQGRPFWLSFEESARRTTDMLVPKAVGGVPLSGDLLAAVVRSLTERINENAPLSLQGAVGGLLQQQAEEAVSAARKVFRKLSPRSAHTRSGAIASPASLDLLIRNATQAALAEFADRAPDYGGSSAASGWLQPYIDQLRVSLTASHSQLRQAQAHAARLAAVSAAERRLRAELDARQSEMRKLETQQHAQQHQRLQELLGNVAVLGVAACATLAPPVVLSKLAPLIRTAPTVLAGLGVWRVAQRAFERWGGPVKDKLEGAAEDMGQTLKAASWATAS